MSIFSGDRERKELNQICVNEITAKTHDLSHTYMSMEILTVDNKKVKDGYRFISSFYNDLVYCPSDSRPKDYKGKFTIFVMSNDRRYAVDSVSFPVTNEEYEKGNLIDVVKHEKTSKYLEEIPKQKYDVRVLVSLNELLEVEATSPEEAEKIVKEMIINGEVGFVEEVRHSNSYGGYNLEVEN